MIYKQLPLYDNPAFDYSLNLDGSTKNFYFTTNARQDAMHMSVVENGVTLESGIRLVPGTFKVKGIFGTFALMPKNNKTLFATIPATEIYSNYFLMYFPVED